jgi:Predicted membrane protein
VTPLLTNTLTVLEVIGIFAFAASGMIEGIRRGVDLFGVGLLSFLTAFGGGTVRDLLLDRRPFFWVENEYWLWLTVLIAFVGPYIARSRVIEITSKTVKWPDAIGLGAWTANGTLIAMEMGESLLVSSLMGVVTAAVGGIIRDLLLNRTPLVIIDHEPYLLISLAGGLLINALILLDMGKVEAAVVATVFMFIVRSAVILGEWKLPSIQNHNQLPD